MADLTISVELNGEAVKSGAKDVKAEMSSLGDSAEKTAKRTKSLAVVDFSGAISRLKEYGSQIREIGSVISSSIGSFLANFGCR